MNQSPAFSVSALGVDIKQRKPLSTRARTFVYIYIYTHTYTLQLIGENCLLEIDPSFIARGRDKRFFLESNVKWGKTRTRGGRK